MTISLALLPVFLLIIIGYLMRYSSFPGDGFWEPAERFLYFFLFPVMLVEKLTYASRDGLQLAAIFLTVLITLGIASLALWLIQMRVGWSGAIFTSVYQGSVRFNSYVGLAAAHTLSGDSGLAIAALTISFMIPLLNLLCIGCFSLSVKQATPGWRGVFLAIIRNPLILGSITGLSFNLLGVSFPASVDQLLAFIGNMALPLGLLCVGAALNLRAISGKLTTLAFSSAYKLILLPCLFLVIGNLLGLSTLALSTIIVLGALPTATASYILARQLGGDSTLMSGIISAQTLLAMASMPLIIPILQSLTS